MTNDSIVTFHENEDLPNGVCRCSVPISVLVGHVLTQWLAENGESLIDDEHKKLEFADYLATKYLANNEIVEE